MEITLDIVLIIIGMLMGIAISYTMLHTRDTRDRETLRAEIAEVCQAKAEADHARLVQRYEARIHELETRHAEALSLTRRDSTNQSRAVLKGKMAEQIAPLLPGFEYWPADARFLGDPVDYIVFNGYSARKAPGTHGDDIEIVILDIKKGARTTLSHGQRQIAKAIEAGRVRFEIMRVFDDGTVRAHRWKTNRG